MSIYFGINTYITSNGIGNPTYIGKQKINNILYVGSSQYLNQYMNNKKRISADVQLMASLICR